MSTAPKPMTVPATCKNETHPVTPHPKTAECAGPKRLIKQTEINDFVGLREHVKELEAEVKAKKEDIVRMELIMLGVLDKGGKIEDGPQRIAIEDVPGRRTPKWKEEFAAACGAIRVQEVIDRTEPSAPIRKIVVTDGKKVL